MLKVPAKANALSLIRRWLPVLLWMAGISYFSSRSSLPPPFSSEHGKTLEKATHFLEYAVLAALLYRALASGNLKRGKAKAEDVDGASSSRKPLLLSFVIASLYAILDEWHQSFVPNRNCELSDVGFDAAGITATLALIGLYPQLRRLRG